ncbi:uncharacterized protein LOC141680774 [Apium graveolens]|uniref:uncharacterized protein LOC141680774 n=1 Tax=Apium graveolens TaxID=4045 RepID=UPI003D798C09
METMDQLLCVMLVYYYLKKIRSRNIPRLKDNTSALGGHAYTRELLNGSNTQCQEMMRLSRVAYIQLCDLFKHRSWVEDSRNATIEEKIAIFLHVISHNDRFIKVKNRFQHSTETLHRYFHEVLNGMMEFAKEVIVPTPYDQNTSRSKRQKKLLKIFSGAIGALDGTLIHAIVPPSQQAHYRGRERGECYQNVLGICDFNMIFTFVWAGWEGVAHDSRILTEVVADTDSGFPLPPLNKYYLCDVAYANTRGFLTPYKNTSYWQADFQGRRALTKEEKFNHAHAQLRNVIERAYGVLKARFPILKQMPPYTFSTQRDIVIACFAVHNFIRLQKLEDELFDQCDNNVSSDSDEEENEEMVEEAEDESQ